MFHVVLVQFVTALVVASAAGAIAGRAAAWTALLAALACTLPNALFALHLALSERLRPRQSRASALPILLGEFCKVVLTIGLLALLVKGYRSVVWPALIVAVGAVLLIQPFALARRRR